jgi:hypothetical protein
VCTPIEVILELLGLRISDHEDIADLVRESLFLGEVAARVNRTANLLVLMTELME